MRTLCIIRCRLFSQSFNVRWENKIIIIMKSFQSFKHFDIHTMWHILTISNKPNWLTAVWYKQNFNTLRMLNIFIFQIYIAHSSFQTDYYSIFGNFTNYTEIERERRKQMWTVHSTTAVGDLLSNSFLNTVQQKENLIA